MLPNKLCLFLCGATVDSLTDYRAEVAQGAFLWDFKCPWSKALLTAQLFPQGLSTLGHMAHIWYQEQTKGKEECYIFQSNSSSQARLGVGEVGEGYSYIICPLGSLDVIRSMMAIIPYVCTYGNKCGILNNYLILK